VGLKKFMPACRGIIADIREFSSPPIWHARLSISVTTLLEKYELPVRRNQTPLSSQYEHEMSIVENGYKIRLEYVS
jgi:hypothetical protein